VIESWVLTNKLYFLHVLSGVGLPQGSREFMVPWSCPWPWFNPHPSGCIGAHSDAILICHLCFLSGDSHP